MSDTLKPCPPKPADLRDIVRVDTEAEKCAFCGSANILLCKNEFEKFYHRCPCCACEGPWGKSESSARRQWNTRPTEAALSARIAELEAAAREVLNELWEANDEFTEYQQALWEKVPLS